MNEDLKDEVLCQSCEKNPVVPMCPCPFKKEIGDDSDTLCECCEECKDECCEEI